MKMLYVNTMNNGMNAPSDIVGELASSQGIYDCCVLPLAHLHPLILRVDPFERQEWRTIQR